MTWPISENWTVSRDSRNWILQERSGKRWRTAGYYPTAEQLLRGLYQTLCLSEPERSDLIEHVKYCSTVVEACTARLSEYIHTELGEHRSNAAQPRPTKIKGGQPEPENLSLEFPESSTQ